MAVVTGSLFDRSRSIVPSESYANHPSFQLRIEPLHLAAGTGRKGRAGHLTGLTKRYGLRPGGFNVALPKRVRLRFGGDDLGADV